MPPARRLAFLDVDLQQVDALDAFSANDFR